jgi:DNA-directed RNA polymerase subunit RPC12/RpoP
MWNGAGYECPMCGYIDEFDKPEQLSQHLQSPRHVRADNMYKCLDCAREFTKLSALCGHFEVVWGGFIPKLKATSGSGDNCWCIRRYIREFLRVLLVLLDHL